MFVKAIYVSLHGSLFFLFVNWSFPRHACSLPVTHNFGDFFKFFHLRKKRIEDFQNNLSGVGEHTFSSCFFLQIILAQTWCGAWKAQKFWHCSTLLHPNCPLDSCSWYNPWTICRSFVLPLFYDFPGNTHIQDCPRQRYMLAHAPRNTYS